MALQGTLDTFSLPDVLRLLGPTSETGRRTKVYSVTAAGRRHPGAGTENPIAFLGVAYL